MKTGGQPVEQALFGAAQIDVGHTDLGESQLTRPPPQLLQQRLPFPLMPTAHAPILETRTLHWPDEATCAAFAATLAQHAALVDAFIELRGPLGAGKTTFVRHLLRALGVQGRIKSPSYAIVEPHELPDWPDLGVWHFDFYRFGDPREWEDAGFRDLFASPGLKLVEWPDKAAGLLPQPDLALTLDLQTDGRRQVTWQAASPDGRQLLDALGPMTSPMN